ncbi:MAG: S8 family serine peptidase [Gemmatimonadetes bacterium]|nr:S8 family serine peptidase [Gemmatimonadota bacterium]
MGPQLKSAARRASHVALVASAAACADATMAPASSVATSQASMSVVSAMTETATHLVLLKGPSGVSTASTSIAASGARVVRRIDALNLLYVEGLSDAAATTLAADPSMTVVKDQRMRWLPEPTPVQPNLITATGGPVAAGTDQSGAQFFSQFQWSLKVTRADQAWVPSNGGAGETVCVLDTGVDPGHLDLAGTVDPTRNVSAIFTPRFASDVTSDDYNFHGTFVAAQIRSRGLGMASVAPNATLCSIKVLSEDGNGTFGDIIYGIYLATQFNADVINLSLGGYAQETNPANAPLLSALQGVIDLARQAGVMVVAASGNDGLNMGGIRETLGIIHIPSQLRGVISVGATGPYQQRNFDALTSYSNYGTLGGIDLVAPGGNGGRSDGAPADYIISACSRFAFGGGCANGRTYIFANGTSFASPLVAGAAAVVESTLGSLPTPALEGCILANTNVVGTPGARYGRGRLNVLRASQCAAF